MANTNAERVIPKASERKPGWIAHGDKVLFFDADRGGVMRVRTGHIASSASSHCGIDNIFRTVVWCDHVNNPDADNADDAHERSFMISDPTLMHRDEAAWLRNVVNAKAWFGGMYQPPVIDRIVRLLTLPDFGQAEEEREIEAARCAAESYARRRLSPRS